MLLFQPLVKYADFTGRARRSEYWLFQLFIALASFAVFCVVGLLAAGSTADENSPAIVFGAAVILLACLASLALIVPGLALMFRRLHDIDKPAAWILIAFVPLVGPVVLLVFCLIDGTPGPNQYGPDPKGRTPVAPPGATAPVVTEVHHYYHGEPPHAADKPGDAPAV